MTCSFVNVPVYHIIDPLLLGNLISSFIRSSHQHAYVSRGHEREMLCTFSPGPNIGREVFNSLGDQVWRVGVNPHLPWRSGVEGRCDDQVNDDWCDDQVSDDWAFGPRGIVSH